jgi:transcriptional regulator GlxA family with amidase domain
MRPQLLKVSREPGHSFSVRRDLVPYINNKWHFHERVNCIYDYSLRHFRRAIQLEEIAAVANISPNSFCRFFKSRTRKTYSRFLLELRVGHACKLLIENNLSIKQICFESGFNNFTGFYKYFKLITGKSPLGYQKEFAGTIATPILQNLHA